jgi:hypothetical protein
MKLSRAWPLVFLVAALPHQANAAGGAYQVDTAEVSEPGSCKVESWASLASNRDIFAATSPACVVDLGRAVEISSQFSRARASDEWSSSATPKIKTNLIPTAIGSWGVAASAQASYDLSTGYNTALFATLPATLRLNETARINLSGGWQWDRLLDRHYLTYGAGFDLRTPNNVWTLTGEVFGQLVATRAAIVSDDGPPAVTIVEPRVQVGLRWRPVDAFNIDLIYGRNLQGENANWITLATTVRFDVGK